MIIRYTHFASDRDPHGVRREKSWEDFVASFAKPLPRTLPKAALPMWSPAVFEADYRHGDFLETVFALGFDVDLEPIPSPQAVASTFSKVFGLYHTSSSATEASPRGRLVLPLNRPVTGPEYRAAWRAVKDVLPFPVGPAAKDPTRAWYVPREGADSYYRCVVFGGDTFDADTLIARAGGPDPDLPSADTVGPLGFIPPERLPAAYDNALDTIADACADACPAPGRRHELSLILAGVLCSDGNWTRIPFEVVPAFVTEVCRRAGFGKLRQKFANAVRTVDTKRGNGAVSGWPSLRRDFPSVAEAIDLAFPTPDLFGLLRK